MSSAFFLYTWTLHVGHEIPAKVSVRAESLERARQTIASHITGLGNLRGTIDTTGMTNPRGLEEAESLRSEINRKLCICAAAAVGIPMNEFCHQISGKNISVALDKILQIVTPTVKKTHAPYFTWHLEPTIFHC
jgi:hypothetical protein